MHRSLQQSLNALETRKRSLLEDFANLTEDRLRFRPSPESWSRLDVLDHLARTEQSILVAMKARSSAGAAITIRDRARSTMVLAVMRSPMRVKVPSSATTVLPQSQSALPEIAARWARTREALTATLDKVPGDALAWGVFRHPVGGWMSYAGTLAFFSTHLQHHGYQLKRLAAAERRI